jgi:hypothetical protein
MRNQGNVGLQAVVGTGSLLLISILSLLSSSSTLCKLELKVEELWKHAPKAFWLGLLLGITQLAALLTVLLGILLGAVRMKQDVEKASFADVRRLNNP